MMKIESVEIAPNPVGTGENLKIVVDIKNVIPYPYGYPYGYTRIEKQEKSTK